MSVIALVVVQVNLEVVGAVVLFVVAVVLVVYVSVAVSMGVVGVAGYWVVYVVLVLNVMEAMVVDVVGVVVIGCGCAVCRDCNGGQGC